MELPGTIKLLSLSDNEYESSPARDSLFDFEGNIASLRPASLARPYARMNTHILRTYARLKYAFIFGQVALGAYHLFLKLVRSLGSSMMALHDVVCPLIHVAARHEGRKSEKLVPLAEVGRTRRNALAWTYAGRLAFSVAIPLCPCPIAAESKPSTQVLAAPCA